MHSLLRRAVSTALPFAITAFAGASASAAIVYVDESATGPVQDGTSWCTAFTTLYDGLAAAVAGDVVRVAGGLYTPDPAFLADPRLATFLLPANVRIEGSYAGCGAPNPDARDPANDTSYIRGDALRDDHVTGDTTNNSFHVMTALNVTGVVLDMIYVDGGKASSALHADGLNGAGLLAIGSRLATFDCIFQGLEAQTGPDQPDGRGGSVYLRKSKARFVDTLFRESIAGESGGGVHLESSHATFEGCFYAACITRLAGGGLYADEGSSARIEDTLFLVCHAIDGEGGGIHAYGASILASRTSFQGSSAIDGAGVYSYKATSDYVNCTFQSFLGASGDGGAMANVGGTTTLMNCLITGNGAGGRGGAIAQDAGKLIVTNSTIAENSAGSQAAGIDVAGGAAATVRNTILWDNDVAGSTTEADQLRITGGATLAISDSDVEGWTGIFGGAGNFGSDPSFVAPGSDYRLGGASPCVDAGSNGALPSDVADLDADANVLEATPLDLDDLPRIAGFFVDIGAYERQ
jgi:hypothetical protein